MNKKYSVLVIEDDPMLLDVCKIILRSNGHQVTTAANGQEGIAALKKETPDLILLDLYMPVMDGKEFLHIFDKKAYPHTKIVIYSNASEKDITTEMLALGADEMVLKSSLSPNELNELVIRIISE